MTSNLPVKFRKRSEPNIEAMLVTESSEQAEEIRRWLGPYNWKPNTIVMRPGCVVVKSGIAPPGSYVCKSKDGKIFVLDKKEFEATYEPA